MHGIDHCDIQLQQGFTAGKHYVLASWISHRPQRVDGRSQGFGSLELAAAFAIGADKICIAELANCLAAIFFAAGPQVAAAKTAKHRRTAGMGTLALQGIKNFFDAVGHDDRKYWRIQTRWLWHRNVQTA